MSHERILPIIGIPFTQELKNELGADADSEVIPLRRIHFRRIGGRSDCQVDGHLLGGQQGRLSAGGSSGHIPLQLAQRGHRTGATICAFGSKLLDRTAFTASSKKS